MQDEWLLFKLESPNSSQVNKTSRTLLRKASVQFGRALPERGAWGPGGGGSRDAASLRCAGRAAWGACTAPARAIAGSSRCH